MITFYDEYHSYLMLIRLLYYLKIPAEDRMSYSQFELFVIRINPESKISMEEQYDRYKSK